MHTAIFATALFRWASPESLSAVEVGIEAQLFIDHRFIERSENIRLKINRPLLPEEEILTFEGPWEENGGDYGTVLEDQGTYKLWYHAWDWDPKSKRSVG